MFAVLLDALIKPIVVVGFLLIMALCGCTTAGERSQLKEEVKEATGRTNTDWVERRQDVLLKAKTRLEDMSKDIVNIEKAGTKAASTKELKSQFKGKVSTTQTSLAEARQSFQTLEAADAGHWESLYTDFKNKMNVVESQFHQLRSMVK